MQLLTLLSICLTLGTNAIATIVDSSSYSYLLQTHVINGGSKEFDGLYVQSTRTGPGTNDVALGKDKKSSRRGQLLKGVQYFDIYFHDSGNGNPETFSLFEGEFDYAWYPVGLNTGVFTSGLFLNGTGLQWTADRSFGGWLACTWSNGYPQLFWKVSLYNYPTPCCARVELRAVEKGKLFKIMTPEA